MTNVFTQKDIERLGATNVMDLLANVPGAVITPPVGMGGTIGFRGLAKNTVNATILVDGIPLNSQGATWKLSIPILSAESRLLRVPVLFFMAPMLWQALSILLPKKTIVIKLLLALVKMVSVTAA